MTQKPTQRKSFIYQQPLLFQKLLPDVLIPPAIEGIPKIDLHRHLIGSISPQMLLNISKKHAFSLPTRSIEELDNLLTIKEPVNGLKPFFKSWPFISKLVFSPDILSSLTEYVLRDAHKDNVVYTELRASWGMTGKESFTVKEFLKGIQDGLTRAEQKYGIIGRIVFGITRHLFARHANWQRQRLWSNIVEAVSEYKDSVVVGFDLSGIEEGYPVDLFLEELQQAQKEGFPITIHCGETTKAKTIWEAIEALHPSRISHALSAVSDEDLLKQLAILQIPIEVCPSTNWLTQTVADLADHPMRKMHASGIKLTVNTDNPAICRSTLSRDYAILTSMMGFSDHDIEQFIKNSLTSMFGSKTLHKKIDRKMRDVKQRIF